MEYYWLILNRTYEITITEDKICGAVVDQIMSAVSLNIERARKSGNAYDLVSAKNVDTTRKYVPGSTAYIALSRSNFSIKKTDLKSISYDPSKKWGMGPVPHTGKLYLEMENKGKIELILLGKINAQEILESLKSKGFPVAIT